MNKFAAVCFIYNNEDIKLLNSAILYYKTLGFNNILLFDTTVTNNSYKLLCDEMDDGFVIYHNIIFKDNIKQNIIKICYNTYKNNFDWIAFFDIDDRLILNTHTNIKNYLTQLKFNKCNIIHIDSKTNILINDAVVAKYDNDKVKCIVRGNYDYFINTQYKYITNILCAQSKYIHVNSNGEPVAINGERTGVSDNAYIENIHSVSFIDFLIKLKNGNLNENRFNLICLSYIETQLKNYFDHVDFTDEHLKQINSIFPDFGITKESIFGEIDLSIKTNIDYVFPFVDDSDELWAKKYHEYKGDLDDYNTNTATGVVRYKTYDLLKYKLRSIEKNMPWIRNIYIIVDSESQIPSWLNTSKIKIVYHKDIIPTEFLPTFNSSTIEMFIGNIEGLSETFLYGNDDFYVNKPVMPYMFFRNNKPLLYLKERNMNPNNKLDVNLIADAFIQNDINIAKKNTKYYNIEKVFQPDHHIKPLLKSKINEVINNNKSFIYNGCTRFREFNNFNQYLYHFYNVFNDNYISYLRNTTLIGFKGDYEQLNTAINESNLLSLDFVTPVDDVERLTNLFDNRYPNVSKYETPIKTAVCVISKLEDQYLNEYAEHYKSIGFNNILFYDNNEIDDNKQYDVLKPYIDEGFVIYNDWKGKQGNTVQKEAYRHCVKTYKDKYDWIAFFDADEFLELVEHKTIQDFLNSNKKFNDFDCIGINWCVSTDNNIVYNDKRPLKDRFTVFKPRCIYKIMLNTNKKLPKKILSAHNLFKTKNICDANGDIIDLSSRNPWQKTKCFNGNTAILNHYKFKTIEEAINRINRGDCNGRHFDNISLENRFFTEIHAFFTLNKITKEKINVIKITFPEFEDKLKTILKKTKKDYSKQWLSEKLKA